MSITRHNYEEFFILYLDNELAPADRRMVEEFVQTNPDLKEELDLLLQYKLMPETDIVFAGKEELMKGQGENVINLSNYEAYLLLYTDNELSVAERKAVEQFASQNLAVKKELDQLGFTRLQPEAIEFPDKASLYRKEEKVRALPVRWWRAAAAILILGLGLASVWLLNNKPATDTAAAGKPDKKGIILPAPVLNPEKESGVAVLQENSTPVVNPENTNQKEVTGNTKVTGNQATVNQTHVVPNTTRGQVPANNNELAVQQPNDKPSNNLPLPAYNPNINKTNDAIAYTPVPETNTSPGKTLTNEVVTNADPVPSDITNASYKEEDGGRKNKLRGFFRKVTRTFEKRTHIDPTDQDNRLLVGGLAIRLK